MTPLDRSLWIDLLGIPFKQFGRDLKGLDCFGLVMTIYKRRGIIVPDIKYGNTDADRNQAITSPKNLQGWVNTELSPGVAVALRRNGLVQHCGVCIDEDRFIHASEDHEAVMVAKFSRNNNFHKKLVAGFYDYRA